MKGEFSRLTFDPRTHFTGTLWQQGRVGSDADWNEWVEQVLHRRKLETTDVIGGCGRPIHNPGFTINIVGKSNPTVELSPGRLYAGGLLAELEKATDFSQQVDWPIPDEIAWEKKLFPNGIAWPTIHSSPDWPGLNFKTVLAGNTQKSLFYAEVWLRHVSALNDEAARDQAFSDQNGKPDWNLRPEVGDYIRERAFGGPDTCTRLQTVAQVKVWDAPAETVTDCPSACAKLARARPSGTAGSLQVNVTPTPPVQKPCEEPLTGGYGGAENRTYRIEVHDPGPAGKATFKWSNENGAFTVRVNGTALMSVPANTDIILQSIGNDQITQLRQNDWVEMCGEETELGMFQNNLVQLVSDPVALPDGTWKVQLTGAVVNPHAPFLRRWSAATQVITLATPFNLDPGSGLSVSFFDANGTGAGNTYFHEMDYWVWAARTLTRDIEPPAIMNTPQAALGIERHYCCLALVTWTPGTERGSITRSVDYCPNLFPPLTEISDGGCECTVTVQPGDSLQSVLDKFKNVATPVTMCLMPGVYNLPAPLLLTSQHSDLTIKGCNSGAILQALAGSEGEFIDGLLVLAEANGITLRGLTFNLPLVPFVASGGKLAGVDANTLTAAGGPQAQTLQNLDVSIGVRPISCVGLTIEDCSFFCPVLDPANSSADVFAAGILGGGPCKGMSIRNCGFNAETLNQVSLEPFQMLIGCVVVPSTVIQSGIQGGGTTTFSLSGTVIQSWNQDLEIRDNSFNGHAAAVLIYGETETVLLENNDVRGAYSGFWILGRRSPPSLEPFGTSSQALVPEEAFQDPILELGSAIARSYPIPAAFNDPSLQVSLSNVQLSLVTPPFPAGSLLAFFDVLQQFVAAMESQAAAQVQPIGLELSVHCSGNQVDAETADLNLGGSGGGLLIWADTINPSSVILSASKIINNTTQQDGSTSFMSTVTILLVNLCVTTGNIILNRATNNSPAGSFYIFPLPNGTSSIPNLAITGNIFQGQTNIPANWIPMNTLL